MCDANARTVLLQDSLVFIAKFCYQREHAAVTWCVGIVPQPVGVTGPLEYVGYEFGGG